MSSFGNMERTDSSAMNFLADYADSDEDDENPSAIDVSGSSSGKRRKTIELAEFEIGDSKSGQLPEPPESFDEASSQTTSNASRKDSPWSDDDDPDRESSMSPKEPPPPARPDFPNSPASSLHSPTPAKFGKMPRIDSSQLALVSYNIPDDENDEEYQLNVSRRKSKEKPEENSSADPPDYGTSQNVNSAPNSVQSTETVEENVDSYALLEQSLDKGGAVENVQNSPAYFPDGDVELPPECTKKCSPEWEEKFLENLKAFKTRRYTFNQFYQSRKDFRNPSMYEKLVEHFGIDELGSNFSKRIFDPHGFRSSDYYDELAKSQRVLMDKADKDKLPAVAKDSEDKKRKSKWDNPGGVAQQSTIGSKIAINVKAEDAGSKKLKL